MMMIEIKCNFFNEKQIKIKYMSFNAPGFFLLNAFACIQLYYIK